MFGGNVFKFKQTHLVGHLGAFLFSCYSRFKRRSADRTNSKKHQKVTRKEVTWPDVITHTTRRSACNDLAGKRSERLHSALRYERERTDVKIRAHFRWRWLQDNLMLNFKLRALENHNAFRIRFERKWSLVKKYFHFRLIADHLNGSLRDNEDILMLYIKMKAL